MSDLKQVEGRDLDEIRDALNRVEHTLKARWWLFSLMWIGLILCVITASFALGAIHRVEQITMRADARSSKNEAAIDAAIKQQIIYQQQLAQYMDYMSKKNPRVQVPRVKVTPPPNPIPDPTPRETPPILGATPLSESDLARNGDSVKVESKPKSHATSSTRKKKLVRKTPTPSPWYKFFKATR